jgi:hypothetical protein
MVSRPERYAETRTLEGGWRKQKERVVRTTTFTNAQGNSRPQTLKSHPETIESPGRRWLHGSHIGWCMDSKTSGGQFSGAFP